MKQGFLQWFLFLFITFMPMTTLGQQGETHMNNSYQTAIFAGGCFWCTEAAFDSIDGVVETLSGYTGGDTDTPSYQNHSGHYEALRVTYDPAVVDYNKMLEIFWQSIDPFDTGGQFYDRGQSYQTAIFYQNDTEKQAALVSKKVMEARLGKPTAPKILPATTFWPAEEYHQNYHQKNPLRYKAYKHGSGRVKKLKGIWGE